MPKKECVGNECLIWMFTQMVRIREFEEAVTRAQADNCLAPGD